MMLTVFFVLICNGSILHAQELPKFTIMTEVWRPYNFTEDGQTKGIAVDLLVRMLEIIGSDQKLKDIRITAWSRGYKLTIKNPHTILFSMTKTIEREPLFKWVGPIGVNITELFARKDKHIIVNNFADIEKYKIGIIIDDVGDQLLRTKGVAAKNLIRVVTRPQVQRLLYAGRIDLTADNHRGFIDYTIQAGYNPNDYESVYVINKDVISYAFHSSTPDSVIAIFQAALDTLKKNGEYDAILKKYQSY